MRLHTGGPSVRLLARAAISYHPPMPMPPLPLLTLLTVWLHIQPISDEPVTMPIAAILEEAAMYAQPSERDRIRASTGAEVIACLQRFDDEDATLASMFRNGVRYFVLLDTSDETVLVLISGREGFVRVSRPLRLPFVDC